MSIRELRTLLAVADKGGIKAAADTVHLSIPAVSTHISNLEDEFAVELIDRRRKPARLTPAGRLLVDKAREILKQYDKLPFDIKNPGEVAGSLSVGASPTVLTDVIPLALVEIRKRHPLLRIGMIYGRPWTLLDMLSNNDLDVAIIGEPRGYANDLSWTPFAREPIVVIAPPHARGQTDEALLHEFPYIRYSRNLWVSREIEEHLSRRNISLKTEIEVDSREAIEVMVRRGLGVSIIPQSDHTVSRFFELKSVPLGNPPMLRRVGLAQRVPAHRSALIDAFHDVLLQCTASYGVLSDDHAHC